MEPTLPKLPTRFYELDLLRCLAALSVVFYHYTYRGYAADHYSPVAFPALARLTRYGYLGVELFFLISGYVILLSAQGKSVGQFLLARAVRLYPAFWVACTLTFLVERLWNPGPANGQLPDSLHAGVLQYGYNMTLLYGFLNTTPLDGAYWSLTVEITFYLLVSLLLAYKLLPHIDFFLTCWLAYTTLAGFGVVDSSALFAKLLMPDYAPYFAAGMLFYLLQQPQGQSWRRYTLLAAAYLLAVRSAVLGAGEMSVHFHESISGIVVAGLITLFFGLFYLTAFRVFRFQRQNWLIVAGAITYPLYLIHTNIGFLAFHRLGQRVDKYLLLGGLLLVMLGASYLIHKLAEEPLRKWLAAHAAKWLAQPSRAT